MVTVENDGSLVFRVYLPHAQSVELVADFTDWGAGRMPLRREHGTAGRDAEGTLHDARSRGRHAGDDAEADIAHSVADVVKTEDGWWTIRTKSPEGDHAFSYLIDDQWWLPDYAAHGVMRNSEGHWTSLLFVPPKPRLAARLERRRHRGDVASQEWRPSDGQRR